MHANHLEAEYGAGPHTLSVPRMRPADGSDVSSACISLDGGLACWLAKGSSSSSWWCCCAAQGQLALQPAELNEPTCPPGAGVAGTPLRG